MKKIVARSVLVSGSVLLIAGLWGFVTIRREFSKMESDDPAVWEPDIRAFEARDQEAAPPAGAVLFVGSSSIRFWYRLEEAMRPIPVVRRGFGGAKLRDITHYAGRIIIPYQPKAIVLFAGTNDITGAPNDKSPEQLLDDFKSLASLIASELPHTRLYYVAITPTSRRWQIWPQARKANQLIARYASTQPAISFIDTTPLLLTPAQQPDTDLLWWDGVHLNRKGYKVWAEVIKNQLLRDGIR
jgi:hypothetical protein